LVWSIDYVDHAEETLHSSFEAFIKRITFKVLGGTKDKWKASTNALKRVFYRLWVGHCHCHCHWHCLKKFREALNEYQKESNCSQAEITRLYKKFKKVLKESTSAIDLRIKIKSLDDEAFNHPLLKKKIG
jgi:hypothetical protein